jgi:acyl-CoA thioesterase FadM
VSDPLAAYTVAVDIDVPDDHFDEQGHLNNVGFLRLFERLRREYMFGAGRLRREALPGGLVVGVRELVCRYEAEVMPGQGLRGGCRVLGRSERSYLFDEILAVDDRVVARCRVLECVIDRGRGKAVPIPDEFWALFERIEARTMPPAKLPFPQSDWSI